MNIKLIYLLLAFLGFCQCSTAQNKDDKVIVAYVTSWSEVMPDPTTMTHINYAFGKVADTFDAMYIDNEPRLRQICKLKEQNPKLKVLVSVGGWGAGNFSEMAADPAKRMAFAKSCLQKVKEFNLDGIDIDWEYPTQNSANISSSPQDTENFTLLMRDLKKVLGKNKLVTCATVANAKYIDFKSCIKYIDLVNTMTYDMGNPPYHHSALYPSEITNGLSASQGVEAHLAAGVPKEKLVMGMPFYGRGEGKLRNYLRNHDNLGIYTEKWDEKGQVPYMADAEGKLVNGFENTRSLAQKCQYILDNGLRGGMYWEYSSDNYQGDERTTLYLSLIQNKKGTPAPRKVLVLAEEGTPHQGFVDAAKTWMDGLKEQLNIEPTFIADLKNLEAGEIDKYHLIIHLNYPPYAWSEASQKDFERYIDEGHGSYIGFHHASLLGDIFDGYTMWGWFSDFMGGIRWKNYIETLTDATVCVEDKTHPITAGVPDTFVIPKDEWYTYDIDPRPNVHVLGHVDEASYVPASDIRMGDHPTFWINEHKKARNVYFQFGHDKQLFDLDYFKTLFLNSIQWCLYDK